MRFKSPILNRDLSQLIFFVKKSSDLNYTDDWVTHSTFVPQQFYYRAIIRITPHTVV